MKKLLTCIIIFIGFYPTTYAIDVKVENAFNGFLNNIQSKYSLSEQDIILGSLRDKLDVFKYDDKYSDLFPIISDLGALTNEELYSKWLQKELSQSQQQIIELRERKTFSPAMTESELPSYISGLLSSSREFIETNSKREFVKGGDIFRVSYSIYFSITSRNISAFDAEVGIVIFDAESGEYRFIKDYSLDKKIPYSELTQNFKHYLTVSHKVQDISGILYAYNFLKYNLYDSSYGAYQSQLNASGFSYDTTLLYKTADGKYNFVTDYEQHVIGSSKSVFGVAEKHLFLDYLREDTKYKSDDISGELEKIKNISDVLTLGVSRDQGIKNIYNWILSNVEYSQNFSFTDEKVFSGVETFKNNDGVCTGYTKLSSYLFYFAGYHDVEMIKGHVIDADDFPDIGHAWLRIGDLYYDPTFDDPIGAEATKTSDQYKYFGLPKDIFYANRFEYEDLPELFKTASKSQIEQHIFNTLSNLLPKYKNSLEDYPIFAKILFKNKYNISATAPITPQVLAGILPSYKVENDSYKFQREGNTEVIKKIRSYIINDNNTESALDIFLYDTSNLTLFDWQTSAGALEWRLSYELELR